MSNLSRFYVSSRGVLSRKFRYRDLPWIRYRCTFSMEHFPAGCTCFAFCSEDTPALPSRANELAPPAAKDYPERNVEFLSCAVRPSVSGSTRIPPTFFRIQHATTREKGEEKTARQCAVRICLTVGKRAGAHLIPAHGTRATVVRPGCK